jgi:hypothetical protein
MKKLTLAIATTLMLATASANAGSMFDPFKSSTPGAFGSPNADVLINNPTTRNSAYSPICFGCTSSITGLPRTQYVRPHFRSNGAFVSGYWRSRR